MVEQVDVNILGALMTATHTEVDPASIRLHGATSLGVAKERGKTLITRGGFTPCKYKCFVGSSKGRSLTSEKEAARMHNLAATS